MTITGRVKPRIEIAPGGNPAGDPSLYAWLDAGKRRQKVDIVIGAGRDDEADEVEAGTFSATMDNRDGRLSPRNILGPYYGSIGRGTPLRLVLDRATDSFTRSVSGSWGESPDGFTWINNNGAGTYGVNGTQATAALPINNATRSVLDGAGSLDVEVMWSTTLDVMPTGASFVSAALLRHTDATNYIRAHVELQAAGTIAVKIQRTYQGSAADLLALTATGLTYSAGTKVWGKARADGPYIMIKTWLGTADDEPDAWHGSGTDTELEGSEAGLLLWRINTNAGTYTAKVDDFELVNILWSGNVPEWSPKWPEKSGTDSTLPVVGAGILRRLSQGSSPVNSPLYNLLSSQVPTFTYYPAQEKSGAQQLTSTTGDVAKVIDVTFAGDDTLNGSAGAAVMNTLGASQIAFKVNSRPTTDGFSALWFFKLGALPPTTVEMVYMRCSGTMRTWSLTVDNTNIQWKGYDYAGTQIADAISPWAVDPRQWVAMQLETNVSGGTTTVDLIWHQVGSETFYVASDSYAGSSSKPDYFSIIPAADSTAAGHFWFGDNDLPFVDGTFMLVSDGYRTELAAERVTRLCGENNIPVYVLAGDTEPMGRQRSMKIVDLLRECEVADQAILCERGNGLMFIPRVRRYNMPVAMALDWSLGHLAEAPEPTDDDQRLRNLWQVSRVDGGSVTVSDETSIATAGTYDDSAELNIAYDTRLVDFAGWFLNRDTSDFLRWPRITIDLIAHPELIASWLSCRVGSRITVANPPDTQLAGEVIDLVIEGWTQTVNNYRWEVELACSPAQPWLIGAYDDATYRYDAVATTAALLGETDTLLAITAADRLGFYSATSVPYIVKVAGQLNRVIGCSAPDSVAVADGGFEAGLGAGWYASGGSVADSTAQAHTGTHSALLTVSGGPSQALIRNSLTVAATPGQTFTSTVWVRCSVTRTVSACIDWYNGVTFLSRAINSVAVTANTWTQITVSGTAPASTTRIEYGSTMTGSPTNGTQLWTDDIDIVRTDAQNSRQLITLERAIDGFPKALPAGSSFRIASPARYGL